MRPTDRPSTDGHPRAEPTQSRIRVAVLRARNPVKVSRSRLKSLVPDEPCLVAPSRRGERLPRHCDGRCGLPDGLLRLLRRLTRTESFSQVGNVEATKQARRTFGLLQNRVTMSVVRAMVIGRRRITVDLKTMRIFGRGDIRSTRLVRRSGSNRGALLPMSSHRATARESTRFCLTLRIP